MENGRKFNFEAIKDFLISKEEFEKMVKKFEKKIMPFLIKNKNSMITFKKDLPEMPAVSTTFGPYEGRQMALYIGKSDEKTEQL